MGVAELRLFRSLTIIGETGLEFLASEEDAALYSAQGKIHLFGDFVVFVTSHVH